MKRVAFLMTVSALSATLNPAQAQTRLGSVTLSTPGQTAPVAQPHTIRRTINLPAAPARTSAVTQRTAASTSNSMNKVSVPSGWYEVNGRISAAAGAVSLPAGSKISVTLNDLTTPMQLVHIQFSTTHLSTPYQMVFNGSRLNSTHTYAVQATVQDASGKQLYRSDRSATLPKSGRSALVNVTVR